MSIIYGNKFGKGTDFWYDYNRDNQVASSVGNSLTNTIKLAKLSRAMSNFATIITGKTVPTTISTKSTQSFTDGNTITVSADISKPTKYDIACGLVLHEASHIALTDFDLLRKSLNSFSNDIFNIIKSSNKIKNKNEIYNLVLSQQPYKFSSLFKDLINIIEDRRIDAFIVAKIPGYINYYNALYKEYFNSSLIDKVFNSNKYTLKKY